MSNGDDVTIIQTDAAVNSGNSGGPLLDRSGAVIGVIFAGEVDGSTGIAYATSSNDLKRALQALSSGSSRLIPASSPTPEPTISPAGHWTDVTKTKITGTSRNTWYTTLYGWGPYTPDEEYELLVRCDDREGGGRELELLMIVYYEQGKTYDYEDKEVIVLYGTGTTEAQAESGAGYPSNPQDPHVKWWQQAGAINRSHSIWASTEARDDIIGAMSSGGFPILVLKAVSGDEAEIYSFDTTGFREAAKEVLDRCK